MQKGNLNMKDKNIKKIVKEGYAKVATQSVSCCPTSSCCGSTNQAKDISKSVGYSDTDVNAVPEGIITKTAVSLGCTLNFPLRLSSFLSLPLT